MVSGALPTGTVTLVFTDIEGSTRLLHEIGAVYGEVLATHHALLREVWTAHDGVEVDTEGDAFFVAFASPSRAVDAVAAAQAGLIGADWPGGHRTHVRMGVHTGEPQVRDGTYWGIDVHYAARLCSAAHGDQVLLSAATRALVPGTVVEDLGEHAVKDFPVARHLFHLVTDGRSAAAFPPPRTLDAARTNLPTMATPLVGREAELSELDRRLADGERLVTLTGAGGTGKTRVAIGAGARLVDRFADGVFLVPLGPVTDPAGVPGALATAISAPRIADLGPERAVREALRDRETLLVIDNFEHVLGAAPFVGELLDGAPGLRVIATSQASLRLAAETVIALEPLGLPDAGERDPNVLGESAAVALFTERAHAADARFALTESNAAAVAELCRALDGLPLALELAAARVRMAGVDGLLDALARGTEALGRGGRDLPERQRGLRAALDWTVSLLEPEQRELLAGLAVFADAWTLEQAEEIFGADIDVWEAMAALLDFSLIRTRGDGRLSMAQRVRTHARELLGESGREHELRARHAELMVATGAALSSLLLLDFSNTIARTRDLLEEFDQAMDWSRHASPEIYRGLLAGLGRPFYFTTHLPAVADQARRLLDTEDGTDVDSGLLMVTGAMIECLWGHIPDACHWTARALACHRQTADPATLAATYAVHAHMLTLAGRGPDARAIIAEGLNVAAGLPDPRIRDQLEGTIAFAAVVEGNFDEAEVRLEAMLDAPARTDFAAHAATSYMGDVALEQRNGERALTYYGRSLASLRGVDETNALLQVMGIAAALAQLGRDAEAALMFGATQRSAAVVDMDVMNMITASGVGAALDTAKQRLGDEVWSRQVARGSELNVDQTIDLALKLSTEGAPAI